MVQPPTHLDRFESLLEIVQALRGENGCPWDKEQTHRTLTPYAIEEAHELAEAIETGDRNEVVGELGDLLLQVVLHAEIGRQAGQFEIKDVVQAISEKMVRRHPHVFSNVEVLGSEEVLANWTKLKAAERKSEKAAPEGRFDIPLSLPALARAHKIGDKTKRVGFDWNHPFEVFMKVMEEIGELKSEVDKFVGHPAGKDVPESLRKAVEHELGDVLFSVAQLSRHLGFEAEQCLRTANARFEARYFGMNKNIEASGRKLEDLTPAEMEEEWRKIKTERS